MDSIAQRLGLVIHWIGLLISVFVIIFLFLSNSDALRPGQKHVDENNVMNCEKVYSKHLFFGEAGDCYPSPNAWQGENSDLARYRRIELTKPSISKFINRGLTDIFEVERFLLWAAILYGWLIRFILVGKVHILPWK